MFLNSFSVRVPEGNESSGYVELQHNTQYTLMLRNNRAVRCDAKVEIDGKHVGTWRVDKGRSIRLERPSNDIGRFTFYKVGTSEARRVDYGIDDSNKGLVRVTFTPEKKVEPIPLSCDSWPQPVAKFGLQPKGLTRSAGVTGLSGKSNQQFTNVLELDYDYSQQTVIHLRLVAKNDEPRPLTAFSTPVPPPVR